ncbi:hypothetical protein Tco_0190717 [Tanacetum coccineum]
MVAHLEKTDGNTEFHETIDFLTRSSIHYALTACGNISKAINIEVISFCDADKDRFFYINQDYLINIQPNGVHEGDTYYLYLITKPCFHISGDFFFFTMESLPIMSKSTSWDQIPTNIATVLKNVHVPLDHFPINALTSKVFSFMVKKGKHFSGNVTPLFESMLVQPTEDEGEALERQSEPQPSTLSSSPKVLVGIMEVTDQAKEIKHLKAQIKKLKKKAKPVITHHKAWMKSVSMKQRLAGKKSLKKK